MKRIALTGLVLMLLLTGCAVQQDPETTEQITTAATEAIYQGLYVRDSQIEQQTQGAVRRYNLPSSYHWMSMVGDKLLLATGGKDTELTVLVGADAVPSTTVISGIDLTGEDVAWQNTYTGFVYYDETTKQAVFLDPQLQELDRVQLPEEIQGKPCFAPDGSQIYFCVPGEIRAIEVERRLSRLIKSHNCADQMLLGCYFEGALLACRVEDGEGNINTLYLSTENGQTKATDNTITSLSTYEDRFLVLRADGTTQQRLVGELDAAPAQLNVFGGSVWQALELGGVVCSTVDDTELHLNFYELSTGKKTAAVSIAGVSSLQMVVADRWSNCIWFLAQDTQSNGLLLLRWDPKNSPVTDETVYTGAVFTADAPDEVGLKICTERVDKLNKEHGITLRIWERAVISPGEYSLEPEYQTIAIHQMLDELEQVLGLFPKNFLYKSVKNTVRICIVRSVDEQVQGVQYWFDGDPFIVLSVGVDVREEFIKGISYVIDSHILGNSPMYDYWSGLNPDGFLYGDENTYSQELLEGSTKVFFSEASMESATEDRCAVFCQAMMDDNAAAFESEIMQKKLLLLCQAIRDSWRLEQKTDVYAWEQYLTESIAYKPE